MKHLDVKKIREQLGLTQDQLADRIGVHERTVQNWESGKNIPKTKREKLREIMGIEDNEIKNEYLKNAFERLGKPQSEIVEDLGKPQSYISELMNGKRNVGRKIAREIADMYGFDYDSILSGRDISEIKAKTYLEKRESPKVSMQKEVGRPFYDVDFTLGFEGVDNDITLHPDFNIDFPPANRDGVNWFRGKGNSMLGDINSGDYIALEEIQDFSWFPLGRIYGIITKNGFRTVKRIVKSDNKDEYMLVSSNPDKVNYPDQALPKDMLHKLYKVIYIIKDLDE